MQFEHEITVKNFDFETERPGFKIFIKSEEADSENHVGYVTINDFYKNEGIVYLSFVWINKNERKKGFAKNALKLIHEIYRANAPENYSKVALNTDRKNTGMIETALSADFEEWEEGSPFCSRLMVWYVKSFSHSSS